jgi:hypothetical protein
LADPDLACRRTRGENGVGIMDATRSGGNHPPNATLSWSRALPSGASCGCKEPL